MKTFQRDNWAYCFHYN